MREIAPRFSGKMAERQAEIIKEAGQVLQATLEAYEINTRLRIAHFLGQTCHESAGFRTTEEFASGAAYEGRKDLGNVKKGDGRLYKGRGLLQLTGGANYAEYGRALGVDLENNPAMAAEPTKSTSGRTSVLDQSLFLDAVTSSISPKRAACKVTPTSQSMYRSLLLHRWSQYQSRKARPWSLWDFRRATLREM